MSPLICGKSSLWQVTGLDWCGPDEKVDVFHVEHYKFVFHEEHLNSCYVIKFRKLGCLSHSAT